MTLTTEQKIERVAEACRESLMRHGVSFSYEVARHVAEAALEADAEIRAEEAEATEAQKAANERKRAESFYEEYDDSRARHQAEVWGGKGGPM